MQKVVLKAKLTPKQFEKLRGTKDEHRYKLDGDKYVLNIRQTRGLLKAWQKAPKYVLRLVANTENRMYLSKDGNLTKDKDNRMEFAFGFDDPERKVSVWGKELGLAFITEAI